MSKAAPAWLQTHREMVDGGAVLMKEPRRLPGGGVETGWGAVGRGQQEVDALSPGLAQISPSPTPALPVSSQGRPFLGAPWRWGEPGTRPQGWRRGQDP